jgi:hypothetical protein
LPESRGRTDSIPTLAVQLTNGDGANRIACNELSGGSKSYPLFLRFSAQRFFIASDNRLLPAGVIPPRLARMTVRFFLIDLILARSAIA